MTTQQDTSVRATAGGSAARELSAMRDVQGVASLLNCSTRHVYRLSDAGRMPRPIKLGALVRWPRAALEAWIAQGYPSCRAGGCAMTSACPPDEPKPLRPLPQERALRRAALEAMRTTLPQDDYLRAATAFLRSRVVPSAKGGPR